MEKETVYRSLFDNFAKPGERFDEEWIDNFDEIIIEEGEVVGTHSWNSGNPGAGAGATFIYLFKGLFFTSDDFGIDGPYEGFSEAAEAVNLLIVRDTTERIWVDFRVNSNSGADEDDDDDEQKKRIIDAGPAGSLTLEKKFAGNRT
jgi:hypothetical protein